MDFQAPAPVRAAIRAVEQYGVYGYTNPGETYDEAVCAWYERNFHWNVQPSWNVRTPGVVFAIACAIRALTGEGDGVLIQQPVYYPFMDIISSNNRELIVNELRLVSGRYEIDFEDFEAKIKENRVKLFILCSPHNPVGRVWSREELARLGDICLKYGVYIISDEIHSDFVYSGHKHTVFANISPELSAKP